jgi:hypothetical protein
LLSVTGGFRRRISNLAALAVVSCVGAGVLMPASLPSRRTPAQVCKAAVAGFARLPAPATLQDVDAGIASAIRISPSNADLNNFTSNLNSGYLAATGQLYGSDLWLNPTGVSAGSLTQAIDSGDGPVANKLLVDQQRIYAAIDRAQKKEKLPSACSSAAFGANYFTQVAAVIRAKLPLSGNFVTDANTACARIGTKIQQAQSQVDITDISSVEDFARSGDQAFKALQIDLQAIGPPPGNPPQYATFRGIVDQAVKQLDQAANPSTSIDKFRALGQQITSLSQPLTSAAAAIGINC